MKNWSLTTCTSSKKWVAELPNCAYKSLKKYSPWDIWQVLRCGTNTFSKFLRSIKLTCALFIWISKMYLKSKYNRSLLSTTWAKTLILGFLKVGLLPARKCVHGMYLRKLINFSDASEVQLFMWRRVEEECVCTLETSSSERDDLNLFDNLFFESLWVECCCNFSKNCMSKILLNISYNPLKKYQIDFPKIIDKPW